MEDGLWGCMEDGLWDGLFGRFGDLCQALNSPVDLDMWEQVREREREREQEQEREREQEQEQDPGLLADVIVLSRP